MARATFPQEQGEVIGAIVERLQAVEASIFGLQGLLVTKGLVEADEIQAAVKEAKKYVKEVEAARAVDELRAEEEPGEPEQQP